MRNRLNGLNKFKEERKLVVDCSESAGYIIGNSERYLVYDFSNSTIYISGYDFNEIKTLYFNLG